jgi:hypothetical protein
MNETMIRLCLQQIRVITKLPNSEQSYKGKVKTHNYINRQNQSTIVKMYKDKEVKKCQEYFFCQCVT